MLLLNGLLASILPDERKNLMTDKLDVQYWELLMLLSGLLASILPDQRKNLMIDRLNVQYRELKTY